MGVYKGVTTSELDELAAETAAHLTAVHPDYGRLAARIVVSNLHKDTKKVFSEVASDLYNYINPKKNKNAPLLTKEVRVEPVPSPLGRVLGMPKRTPTCRFMTSSWPMKTASTAPSSTIATTSSTISASKRSRYAPLLRPPATCWFS